MESIFDTTGIRRDSVTTGSASVGPVIHQRGRFFYQLFLFCSEISGWLEKRPDTARNAQAGSWSEIFFMSSCYLAHKRTIGVTK